MFPNQIFTNSTNNVEDLIADRQCVLSDLNLRVNVIEKAVAQNSAVYIQMIVMSDHDVSRSAFRRMTCSSQDEVGGDL